MNKSLILTILFCLYSLLAICKPIHTNRKSIAFGITVITHGFQPPNANPLKEGEWVLNMARAIKNKYGGKILTYKKQTGLFETLPNEPISEGETVLLFDWADESWFNIEGYSEAAGDALFAALIKSGLKLENLHFIGHSRGCVVTTEVVERLLSIGVNVDHVTNLDPHDWGGMSNLGMAIGSDFDNHPELDPIKSPIGWDHNNGVICWDGIHFSDTYWHQRGKEIDLDGRPVFGSYCERWYNVYHTDIHENGYTKTIKGESITPNLGGYEYSRLGDSHLPTMPMQPRIKPTFNFFKRITTKLGEERIRGIMNGSFDRGKGINIPGWQEHGGGGNSEIIDGELRLALNQKRAHNFFYIPNSANKIRFKLRSINKCSDAYLEVVAIYNGTQKNKLSVSLDKDINEDIDFDISEYKNKVISIEFRTIGSCSLFFQGVYIDNVEFGDLPSSKINLELFNKIVTQNCSAIVLNASCTVSPRCAFKVYEFNEESKGIYKVKMKSFGVFYDIYLTLYYKIEFLEGQNINYRLMKIICE